MPFYQPLLAKLEFAFSQSVVIQHVHRIKLNVAKKCIAFLIKKIENYVKLVQWKLYRHVITVARAKLMMVGDIFCFRKIIFLFPLNLPR